MANAVQSTWRQLLRLQGDGRASSYIATSADPTVPVGTMPTGVVITPDGAKAYVLNEGDGTVSVITTATNTVILPPISVGAFPFGAAVTPNGAKVYVTNTADGTVSVISTASNSVLTTVTVGTAPMGVAVAPDGAHAYVANNADGTVSVITTATDAVLTTVSVGNGPTGVAVANTPDGTNVYVTNNVDGTVRVLSTASNSPITTIPVGNGPSGVAFTPDGTFAYVANTTDNTVTVIKTATNTPIATVPVGHSPIGVAVSPDGLHVYVVNNGDNNVSVINTATNTVTTVIPVRLQPVQAAVTPNGAFVYVTNNGDNSVSVVPAVPYATATTLATAPDPSVFGQLKVFTATVTSASGTPTGSVNLFDGATTLLGTAVLDATGTATFTTGALPVGTHSLTAVYSGDANFSTSTSPVDIQTVNKAATTTTLSSFPNPSTSGQTVVLTAQVTATPPGAGTPTGTVTFRDGATVLGTGTLDGSGKAMLSVPGLSVGTHSLTATYSGDANFNGSSGSLSQTVNGRTTTLTAAPATIRFDLLSFQFVIPRLSATLTDQNGAGIPGRVITFSAATIIGSVILGSAVTDATGTATLSNVTAPFWVILADQYVAAFAGDATFAPSSATAPLVFNPFPWVPSAA